MAEGQVTIPNGTPDDTFEQDLQEILDDRDAPQLHDLSSTVLGNTSSTMSTSQSAYGSSSYAASSEAPSQPSRLTRSYTVPPATSNIPLSSSSLHNHDDFIPKTMTQSAQSKIEYLRAWSVNTYKCTRQLLSERFGKGSRTVDLELEAQIEQLRDTQRKYANILRLARALTNHFFYVVQTQRALGDAFADLSQKSNQLQEEFTYNAETQRTLCKNGEILLGGLNFFTSSVNTLCNKTIEDTLATVKQFEAARLEYDAYRSDIEALSLSPRDSNTLARQEAARIKFEDHRKKFERLRGDVAIKLKFLEENKVKVMHKQLLLFHNAVSAYFSGNETALETTLKQFNIKLKTPNSESPSWIEQ